MARVRLLWKLIPSYLIILLFALGASLFLALRSVRTFHQEQARVDLQVRATLFTGYLDSFSLTEDQDQIQELSRTLGIETDTRITVILPSGNVVADSNEDPGVMDNHADRPEVAAALRGTPESSIRYSDTVRHQMLYTAIPYYTDDGTLTAVVRTSFALTALEKALNKVIANIIFIGLIIALLAAAISLVVSRHFTAPLQEMTSAANGFARGEFTHLVPPQEAVELDQLAEAMNWMATRLDEQINTIRNQRNEISAILTSMVEGLIAVDSNRSLININDAAARLLGINPEKAIGKSYMESVRHIGLQEIIEESLDHCGNVENEISLFRDMDRFLQVHGSPLEDKDGNSIGALIVLNDITRMKRLENIRREFVANVSHELKTPITTIKGFVETLLDGASEEPENAKHFLEIISNQSDRLTSIINDILSLSQIESEGDSGTMDVNEANIKAILLSAADGCNPRAEKKSIAITTEALSDLTAHVNADMLEQAVVNLIDNAIKYSPNNTEVAVSAHREADKLLILVTDEGKGVAAEHIPRLFERFYRVDKARSREMGGTGLGLAIVKHIAQAHRGLVQVESRPGHGSTFTISIPLTNI